MAGRGSLAATAVGYGETRIHAVYFMGRTEDVTMANGSCGRSPGLED